MVYDPTDDDDDPLGSEPDDDDGDYDLCPDCLRLWDDCTCALGGHLEGLAGIDDDSDDETDDDGDDDV